MEAFLKSLGITGPIEVVDGVPTVILKNSNEYARVYSILERSDLVDIIPEDAVINASIASLKYESDEFELVLSGDLSRNIYKLTIEEIV